MAGREETTETSGPAVTRKTPIYPPSGDLEHTEPTSIHQRATPKITENTKQLPRCQLSIGGQWYVVGQKFQGELYMHIREYTDNRKKLIPTKKGICLTLPQWKELQLSLSRIAEDVHKVKQSAEIKTTWHLGNNWIVTVDSRYPGLDIRKFWLPPAAGDIHPTKKGIHLTFEEFEKLKLVFDVLPMFVPEVEDVMPCYMQDDHNNQMGALRCKECNPNDFHNW